MASGLLCNRLPPGHPGPKASRCNCWYSQAKYEKHTSFFDPKGKLARLLAGRWSCHLLAVSCWLAGWLAPTRPRFETMKCDMLLFTKLCPIDCHSCAAQTWPPGWLAEPFMEGFALSSGMLLPTVDICQCASLPSIDACQHVFLPVVEACQCGF